MQEDNGCNMDYMLEREFLDIVLCIVLLAVAIGLINKAYVYKKDEMSVKEMVMLIIPSLVGVTGYGDSTILSHDIRKRYWKELD